MSTALPPRMRRVFAVSLGATLAVIGLLVAVLVVSASTAEAATCSLTSTVPTVNWTDTSKWSGCGGSYPGAAAGDTAVVGLSGFSLTVDNVIPNGVVLQLTAGSINVSIPSGNSLQIEASSSSTSSNTITISGGQLGVGSGTVTWGGNLVHNTGTLALTGTLANTSGGGSFSINGGSTNGPGTLQVVSGSSLSITSSGGSPTINGALIDNGGAIFYSVASPNTLMLSNGGKIRLQSGSSLTITSDGTIQTNNVGSPAVDILSGGTLQKTTSASTMRIDAAVNNAGSVSVSSGRLNLYGGGTHTGSFTDAITGAVIAFDGSHTFNPGATASTGTGSMQLDGGTFSVNTLSGAPLDMATFSQNGGTISGTGTFRVSNSYSWSAGTQTSSGTTQLLGATNVNGSSVTLSGGRIVSNSGTFNYGPNSPNFLTIDGGAHIDNTGTFNLTNDQPIASSSPATSYIETSGSGTFNKTAGTTSQISCGVDLLGGSIVPAANTTIQLLGGSSTSGKFGGTGATINLSNTNSKLDLAGSNFYKFDATASGLTVTGSGTLRLSASAGLAITGGPIPVANFVQDGTSLLKSSGAGISVPSGGTYSWNGGTIDGLGSGGDLITVNGSGILKITGSSGAMTLQNSATVRNNGGSIDFNPLANLAVNSGALIDNAGGTFTFNNNNAFGITSDQVNNPGFTNDGTVIKAANPNTVSIAPKFNNNTTLFVNGGTLQLSGGGTNVGSVTITNAADRLEIAGSSSYIMSAGSTVGGSGTLAVMSGSTLTNNTALNVNNFELNSGGTVNGGGAMTINLGLKWTGGTFSGTGSATLAATKVADATALLGSPGLANGFTFNNNGTFNYNPSFNFVFSNTGGGGATFNNGATGVFDVQGNGTTSLTGSGHSFVNSGIVKKTAGAGGFSFTVPFTNSGTVDEQFSSSSTIAFSGSGSSMTAGTIKASNAAGNIDFVSPGAFTVSGGSFAGPGAINLKGGSLAVNAAQTFPPVFNLQGGQLQGTQTIDVPSGAAFNWNGGSVTGSAGAVITVKSGGTMTLDSSASSLLYDTRPLLIDAGGTVNWNNGTNSLIFQSGAPVTVNGAFNVTFAGSGTLGNSTAGSFSVAGTFAKNSAGTLTVTLPMSAAAGGTISSQGGGTLALTNTGIHSGTLTAAASSFFEFGGGTHQMNATSSFSGTGTFKVNAGTLNLLTNVTAANFGLTGGSVIGSGNLDVSTNFGWTGGQMAGTGTTNSNGTASFTTGPLTLNRNLVLNGNTTMNAASGLSVQTTATVTNNATFTVNGGSVSCVSCTSASFANNGTLASGAASSFNWSVPVTGTGALNVSGAGAIFLNAAASFGTATMSNGGIVGTAGPITMSSISTTGGQLAANSGGAITVSGAATFAGGPPSVLINGGTLTLNGTTTADRFSILGGTLAGSGNVTITPAGDVWTGGTITGSGTLTIAGGSWSMTGSGAAMNLSKPLVNNGNLFYTASVNPLTISAPGSIVNNGVIAVQAAVGIGSAGSTTISNSSGATLQRASGPTAAIAIDPAFSNAGTASFATGTTTFTNGYAQSAGTTTLTNAAIGAPSLNFTGGTFLAKGTVNGNVVVNGAAFNPGNSPGAVTVNGNYTQSSAGTMNVELNGTVAGTSYDQLNITGNAALAGTLNVTTGYAPANNDTFDVLTIGGTRTGDFTTKNIPALAGPGTLTAGYIPGPPEKLRLQAVVPNPDLTLAVSAPATVFHGQTATVTYTVTNVGSNAASGVTFGATLTGGSLASITAAGPCTTGPISCSLGTLAGGASTNVVLQVSATTVGSISLSANVSSSTTDPTPANNSTNSTIAVVAASDFGILSATAPPSIDAGSTDTFFVNVKNGGPDAGTVTVNLTVSGGSIATAGGAGFLCSVAPGGAGATCNSASMAANASGSIAVDVTAQLAPGSVTLNASLSSAADPNAANNNGSATAIINAGADLGVTKTGPATASLGATVAYDVTVTNNGPLAAANVVLDDPTPARLTRVSVSGGGCTTLPCTLGTLAASQSVVVHATYTVDPGPPVTIVNVASVSSPTFDPNGSNNTASATTAVGCSGSGPTPIAPAANATVASPATFSWGAVPGAINYTVTVTINGTPLTLGPTAGTSISSPLPDGSGFWSVSVNFGGNCTAVPSPNVPFTVCSGNAAPQLRLVSESVSGQQYKLEFDAVAGATGYEVDEATNAAFTDAVTTALTATSLTFTHSANSATPYFYRARAFLPCIGKFGPNSPAARVVITPVPTPNDPNPNANVPAGSNTKVVQVVHVPGQPGGSFPFSATTDQPWLTVTPATGTMPPAGLDFTVSADPANLPNGTFTGTIIVTLLNTSSSSTRGVQPLGNTTVKAPVSISLVTPVSSTTASGATPASALIIPSVGHLNGINSVWRSDIRLANTGFSKTKYQLTFRPSGDDASKPVKQTTIEVDAGGTTALDDIVRNWYGVGSLGEAANGVLEIRPLSTAGKGGVEPQVDVAFATAVSSRTYNVSAQGTLGQFIPAVPFASFVGKAAAGAVPTILGLQQIAQNAAYRTNLGLVEAAGKPADVQVDVFDGAGSKVFSQVVNLAAGEQKQLNSFLGANGITLGDGRVEVQVTGGDGRITAYASRVDNATGDPLLVTGTPLNAAGSTRFVIPGIAALNTGFANWQSDVRMYNPTANAVNAMVTYYPQNNSGSPSTTAVTLNPGETKQFDNILQSLFGLANTGGALHINTNSATNLLVSGRTFNQTSNGTYGQYIPAVTPAEAVGAGGNSLQILQAEESVRYRTNVGIAEVTGKPAEVELMIFVPGSKTAARTTFTLGANEFRQYNVIHDIGLENVYNARVQVRVLSGDGKVAAYGSVVDMQTQDPTYIPAQPAQ